MSANALVPAGALSQRSGGETSSASQVYLRGMSAPAWKAELMSANFCAGLDSPLNADPAAIRTQEERVANRKNDLTIRVLQRFIAYVSLPLRVQGFSPRFEAGFVIDARRFAMLCFPSEGTAILLNRCLSAIGTVASMPTFAVNMPSCFDGSMLLARRFGITTGS